MTIRTTMTALVACLVLAACTPAGDEPATDTTPADAQAQLDAIYHEFDEEFLALNPLFATFRGDNRFNDQWGPGSLSDEYGEAMRDLNERYLARLLEVDPDVLEAQDRSNYEIFKLNRENAIERDNRGFNDFENLTPVSQFGSTASFVAMLGSGSVGQPFNTPEDYDNWVSRVAGFTNNVDLTIEKLREGVELGVVQPRILMEKSLPQLAAHIVDDVESSAFWQPIANMPEAFSDEDRKRITEQYRSLILNDLVPLYSRLHDYIQNEYLPHTRETIGQSDVPGGSEYYQFMVSETTTTGMTAEEIHEIGKAEATRLYAEMEAIRDEVGFDGDMQEFFEYLRTDPKFFYDDPQDLLDGYEDLRGTINAALPVLFETLPVSDYVLKEVEEFRAQSMAAAQYFPASVDGTRPGIFYVNTFELGSRPKYVMEALSLHEANPGHHFQVALAQELEEMPAFRRFSFFTAYIEGWGLYAESLGEELGLYKDPYQKFGSLFFDIWRANRLVVDTGMHALGWSRQDAIDWMLSNSPMTEVDVIAEVERYIAIPSQALAYKIGQLKIRELRTRAEETLGEDFDVRRFHTQILMTGALPLSVLEDKLDRWVAAGGQ